MGAQLKKNMFREGIRVCNVDEEGRFGGPERRIVQVAKALKEFGVDTHILHSNLDCERFAKEIAKAGIKSTAMGITRLTKEKKILARYILRFPLEIFRLILFFRKHEFDLVHVNSSYQFKVALAAKLGGIPVVWHLNDTKMFAVVKELCIFISKYCASGFIVAGKKVYDFYIRGNKLEHKPYMDIHAPVDTAVFDPNRVAADKKISQLKARKIITVSGFNPAKGLEYFIDMASNLRKNHDDLVFFVAGAVFSSQMKRYRYLRELVASRKLTEDKFIFSGMVEDVASFLQCADICVFTSIAEASPAAVWEAMSMGKAIVATDVGSIGEYIEDGISGFVVPNKNVDALCEKVELFLRNPTLREKMGAKARAVAWEKLDVALAAQKHASIYRRILSLSSV